MVFSGYKFKVGEREREKNGLIVGNKNISEFFLWIFLC